VKLTAAFVLAVVLAGCGSSSGGGQTVATRPSVTHEAVAAPALPPACASRARAALGHGTRAEPFTASNGADACRLTDAAAGITAIVLLDSAPQAYMRMEREVVEFGQNVDWTKVPPGAYPRTIKHLGLDANSFPLQSRLLTTDGVRLITIKLHGPRDPAAKRALAVRLARVYLGPLRKPPGY
jgi:hypothetical protein